MDRNTRSSLHVVGLLVMVAVALFILNLASGCSSSGKSGPKFIYPPEIEELCIQSRNEAKDIVGGEAPIKRLEIHMVEGERNIQGEWLITNPHTGRQVPAYFVGVHQFHDIYIAYNPETRAIDYRALLHEQGHSVSGDNYHNPKYKGRFMRWED